VAKSGDKLLAGNLHGIDASDIPCEISYEYCQTGRLDKEYTSPQKLKDRCS